MSSLYAQDAKEIYCAKIHQEKDKINGSITYRSPATNEIVFTRYTKKDKAFYMVHLKKSWRLKDTGYGATIILANGQKIYRHLKISIRITDENEFEHYLHFKLTDEEMALLQTHVMTDVILHELKFPVLQPEKYQAYIQCIENMK
jgi:hypothetical protein